MCEKLITFETFQNMNLAQNPGTPSGFILLPDGLYKAVTPKKKSDQVSSDGKQQVWLIQISNYIRVTAKTHDKNSHGWGIMVEFKDMSGTMCKSHLARTSLISKSFGAPDCLMDLYENGFHIIQGHETDLIRYLSDYLPPETMMETSSTGWNNACFVLPNQIIGKSQTEVFFNSWEDDCYKLRGSLEEWKEQIGCYCVGNARLIFAVSCAFAAPLLTPCELEGGGFHFYGQTSKGKTTLLKIASSVCGNKNYLHSWRTTDNALESTAEMHNDTLLVLDELGQLDGAKAGDIAYMLANGQGKIRANKKGNARPVKKWTTLFLSSGEIDFQTHIAESRKLIKEGQEVRFLSIPATVENSTNGIFDTLHEFKTSRDMAEHFAKYTDRVYGYPLNRFLESIAPVKDNLYREFNEYMSKLRSQLPVDMNSVEHRAFKRFALVGFAGEKATDFGITGWTKDDATKSVMALFDEWKNNPTRMSELDRLKQQVKLFFQLYGKSRFQDCSAGGAKDKVLNRAGYYFDELNYRHTYWVFPEVLRTEILKGFDFRWAKKALVQLGWIIPDKDKIHFSQKKNLPDCKNMRLFVFDSDMFVAKPASYADVD